MKFGENLKQIRKSKNISQEELAERLGVSRQSVSKWETGENYPSMFNIMCLCDIFKCKINNLVHESMPEFNSLDEEIKMSVVKFKENEQKKMKGFTKVLYIVSNIAKVFSIIAIVFSLLLVIGGAIVIPNTTIDKMNNTIKVFDKKISYELTDEKLVIDGDVVTRHDKDEAKEMKKFIHMTNKKRLALVEFAFLTITAVCFISFKLFSYLSKLFKNIHDSNTPFNMDNVNYIKKLALYSFLFVLVPDVTGAIAELIFSMNLSIEVSLFSYLFSLILLVLAYIFKYGYEIQLDSKGVMYSEK
ncbi:MAG: helix-turn-helix domain-containing protein [Bacilli bacterium]|nr:helix-turn-helix domain-containing protein [Bacilli bacterium]